MKQPQILIIDLGSQYTLVISRTLRELRFRSIILLPGKAAKWLQYNKPKGIILSGGSASVYDEDAPQPPVEILEKEMPVLGICYGMQWMAKKLGGFIESPRGKKEYGRAKVKFKTDNVLFRGCSSRENEVWASHGDSVVILPRYFDTIATPAGEKGISAMASIKENLWGVQFHPEVTHTKDGKTILRNFVSAICDCEPDWKPGDIIKDIQEEAREAITSETLMKKRVIIGFSGGVDSTMLSAILAKSLGNYYFLAVCIDTGALRQDELKEIKTNAKAAGARLKIINARKRFQKAMGRATDAQTKRLRFKKLYGRILEEEARAFGADFIAQGTLATDIIESGKVGNAALIKSHHNVGLDLKIRELHPLRNLFKYEVRDLAKELGLPESISRRQPFPGPGLFVRIIGQPPTPKRLAILRWADAEVVQILKKHDVYGDISQLIVGLACLKTVGIKGDGRVYEPSVIVRAVKTLDFMTVAGFQIPDAIRAEITESVTKHPNIVRVFFDETNKPPATTELE